MKSWIRGAVRLCDAAIEMGGVRYEPDATKSYLLVDFAHGPPSVTFYGESVWPAVAARHHASMLHQQVNVGHRLRIHDAEADRDEMIGLIVATEYPPEPEGGWRVAAMPETAPCIRAVVCLSKMLEAVPRMLVEAAHGQWSVSMEVLHRPEEGAWIWQVRPGDAPVPGAVAVGDGWLAVPAASAPADLNACWDADAGHKGTPWRGRMATRLMGGLSGGLHFMGLGIVKAPAEREAGIRAVRASRDQAATAALRALAGALKAC